METLAIVEVVGRGGEILRRERIAALPAYIGRGFKMDLIFDDPYVAASHLRLDADDGGGFIVTDLGSINGFSVPTRGNQRQGTTAHIEAGEIIRLGHTQIRVWYADSPVAEEIPERDSSDKRSWLTFIAWLVVAPGLMSVDRWIEATGPGRYGTVGLEFLLWAAVVLIWSGLWWVSSRSSHRVTTFIAHGAVGASTLVITELGLFVLNTAFFAFDLYRPSHGAFTGGVLCAGVALAIYRHLRLVSRKARSLLLSVSLAVAVVLVVPVLYTLKENDLDKIGLMDIPGNLRLPWMRIADGVSPEEFLN